ncbi:WAP four-disulfide core domain protein 3-like [Haliotis asinina]|uniref:WAP four-disulfide core domain protein 3-like n=1 Tax=Haliotis asinina TaxID=109174 RepID=UPI003531EBDF
MALLLYDVRTAPDPSPSTTSNPCVEGSPLITTFGLEKTCTEGVDECPGGLGCVAESVGSQGRCCPTGGPASVNSKKPGSCPASTGNGICFNFCGRDIDCVDSQKCCFNGCGHACVDPQSETSQVQPSHRNTASLANSPSPPATPGTCPTVKTFGECVRMCRSDSECSSGTKCCSNGCGWTCQSPVLPPKPGTCPRDYNNEPCFSLDQCEHDSDCTGSLKCCSTNCGKQCREPNSTPPPRPGVCPAIDRRSALTVTCSVRFDLCLVDVQCPGTMKCCKSVCGKKCQNALPHQVRGKRGQCPAPRDNPSGYGASLCVSFCTGDSDCPMTQKCCLRSDGCSHICTKPIG